jgi:hypothetical protein
LAEVAQERRLKLVAWSTLSGSEPGGRADELLQRADDAGRVTEAEPATSLAALSDTQTADLLNAD